MPGIAADHPAVPDYRRQSGRRPYSRRQPPSTPTAGRPVEGHMSSRLRAGPPSSSFCGGSGPSRIASKVPRLIADLLANGASQWRRPWDAPRDLGRSGEARDRHTRAAAVAEALASAYAEGAELQRAQAPGQPATAWPGSSWTPAKTAGADADARRAVTLFAEQPARDGREWFSAGLHSGELAAAGPRRRREIDIRLFAGPGRPGDDRPPPRPLPWAGQNHGRPIVTSRRPSARCTTTKTSSC